MKRTGGEETHGQKIVEMEQYIDKDICVKRFYFLLKGTVTSGKNL